MSSSNVPEASFGAQSFLRTADCRVQVSAGKPSHSVALSIYGQDDDDPSSVETPTDSLLHSRQTASRSSSDSSSNTNRNFGPGPLIIYDKRGGAEKPTLRIVYHEIRVS